MKILFLIFSLFSFNLFSFEVENIIIKELKDEFHHSVDEYNKNKKDPMIEIKFDNKNKYKLQYKNDVLDFTIVNVLKNQFYVNGKLFHFTKVLNANLKNSFIKHILINEAYADDLEKEDFSHLTMNADSTKILLSSLGEFVKNLSQISTISFDPCISATCIKTRREGNLAKLLSAAEAKTNRCEELKETQMRNMKDAQDYMEAEYLPSINHLEFNEMKSLLVSISNKKMSDANDFLEKTIAFKNRPYKTCIQILLSGTLGDSLASDAELGRNTLGALGGGEMYKNNLYNKAGAACEKFEELRDCIVDLNKNFLKINSLKRSIKKTDGGLLKQDQLPNLKSISK